MGGNVYITAVGKGLGYKTATAATVIEQTIDPRSGERIAIRAYGFTNGGTADIIYFMQAFGTSTLTAAVASGATTGLKGTAEFQLASNILTANDNVCIELDNGKYQYTTIATGGYAAFSVSDALEDTVAAGNRVWAFGLFSDTGHYRIALAASSQTTNDLDGGIFYAAAKNYPMMVYHPNNSAVAGSHDYVTVDYINK